MLNLLVSNVQTKQTLRHISNKRRDSESAAGNQSDLILKALQELNQIVCSGQLVAQTNSIIVIIRVSASVGADAIELLLAGLSGLPFAAQA